MSLAVHWSHGIAYDPVFAIGDWVSRHMGMLLLIFPTAPIKAVLLEALGKEQVWSSPQWEEDWI